MRWDDAVRALGGKPTPTDLTERYAEPHRRYHGVAHVEQVVRDAAALTSGRDRALAVLAAWAHDVVYNGQPGEDERASAEWARTHLTASGVPPADVDRVVSLILTTIDHSPPPGDLLAEAVADADLAVLGSAPAEYDHYREAVRHEYSHLSEDEWRAGRAAVLRGLLAKDPLFRTPVGRAWWETAARQNMARELAATEAERPPPRGTA